GRADDPGPAESHRACGSACAGAGPATRGRAVPPLPRRLPGTVTRPAHPSSQRSGCSRCAITDIRRRRARCAIMSLEPRHRYRAPGRLRTRGAAAPATPGRARRGAAPGAGRGWGRSTRPVGWSPAAARAARRTSQGSRPAAHRRLTAPPQAPAPPPPPAPPPAPPPPPPPAPPPAPPPPAGAGPPARRGPRARPAVARGKPAAGRVQAGQQFLAVPPAPREDAERVIVEGLGQQVEHGGDVLAGDLPVRAGAVHRQLGR